VSANARILTVEQVSKSFPMRRSFFSRATEALHAVVDVSLEVAAGETLGIVGESGCGKTTLARLMVRLHTPDRGRILFRERDLASMPAAELRSTRTRLQMVFQDPYSSLNPRMAVGDAIAEPLHVHRIVPPAEVERERDLLMERVGLSRRLASRLPRELSGGQRQRVSIARALSVRPEVLIADEAVSSLDVSVRAQILNLLADLRAELGLTLIFISHDLSVVDHLSDRVAVMYLGRVVELGPTADVLGAGGHPYTRGLVAAIPQPVVGHRRSQPAIRGELPSAIRPPTGCVFRTRCPMAQSICAEVLPPNVAVGPLHWTACHYATVGVTPAMAEV
jgi:oligopeptide/dipeptide ABC transporter ATP-binding protein